MTPRTGFEFPLLEVELPAAAKYCFVVRLNQTSSVPLMPEKGPATRRPLVRLMISAPLFVPLPVPLSLQPTIASRLGPIASPAGWQLTGKAPTMVRLLGLMTAISPVVFEETVGTER